MPICTVYVLSVFLDLAVLNRIPSVAVELGGLNSMHGTEKYSYNFNPDKKRQIEKQRQRWE
jgi:hypothetical protein